MITVIIADDHHLVRQGIRALLERQPEIKVVGEAQDGLQALDLCIRIIPDVLILDINMPNLNGIEVSRRIQAADLRTQVLILSMYSDESLVKRAFRNGVKGYLLKKSISEDLMAAVSQVSMRQIYLSPELGDWNLDEIPSQDEPKEPEDRLSLLTDREREICYLIAQGLTNRIIASQLGISVKTVEKHRANLMDKLDVTDVPNLVREAIRLGVIFLED